MTASNLLPKLQGVTRAGGGWQARCPAHEDKQASLSIGDGDKGIVLHCHAGCSVEAICGALGLKLSDLFKGEPKRNGGANIVATYDYTDPDGKLLFQVCRLNPKKFLQRRPDGNGDWIWNMNGVGRVLFRLPEVTRDLAKGLPIYIAEGEKDVLALVAAGFSATCNPGGAGKWSDAYTAVFKGAEVVIVADKDEPGRKHARLVAGKVEGAARAVRVLELPDVNGKAVKDPADYFAAGGTAADLDDLVQGAPIWTPGAAKGNREYLLQDGETPAKAPDARPLSALTRPDRSDPDELLRFRFLCRGGGLVLCGPTGVGKSSLAIQCMIFWALGRGAFGIVPARPLKSLLVQAENDDGDLAEMRDGVVRGLKLDNSEAANAMTRVIVAREDSRTGRAFLAQVVGPLLEMYRPDLLWLDPALAYLGGETGAQKDVTAFLRNGLNPLLHEFNCAAIIIHHTNKPPAGREKPNWQAGDFAYLGSGSIEWANWARAVLALRSIGSHDVFELRAGKRGGRLGWREADGETKAYARHLAHSREADSICWRETDPGEAEVGGRPKTYDPEELLALLPPEGLETAEWVRLAKAECGVSETTLHRERRAFLAAGRILKSKINGKWQPLKKT